MRLKGDTLKNVTDYKGVTVAAARVYKARKDDARVSREPTAQDPGNRPANQAESLILGGNLENFRNVVKAARNPNYEAAVTDRANIFRSSIVPANNPKRFQEVSKDLTREVTDPSGNVVGFDFLGLFARTDPLENTAPNRYVEQARATGYQLRLTENNVSALPDVNYNTSPSSRADSLGKRSSPEAVAIALNRDPFGVEWANTDRRIDLALTGLSMFASATGDPATARAWYGLDGSIVDGTVSIDAVDEASSLNRFLYSLDILNYAYDGQTFSSLGLTLGEDVTVSDSDGYSGLDVLANLGSILATNAFSVPDAYVLSFDFGPSADTTDPFRSVLFVREAGAAVSAVVPEPSGLLLLAATWAALLWRGAGRRRLAA
jgi:hypothetical protein